MVRFLVGLGYMLLCGALATLFVGQFVQRLCGIDLLTAMVGFPVGMAAGGLVAAWATQQWHSQRRSMAYCLLFLPTFLTVLNGVSIFVTLRFTAIAAAVNTPYLLVPLAVAGVLLYVTDTTVRESCE